MSQLTEKEHNQILHVAIKAGQKMSEAGAETYRVEQTVSKILSLSGHTGEAYALSTGLFACIDLPDQQPMGLVRRVQNRGLNLHSIHTINQISRDLVQNKISLDEADRLLDELERFHYPQNLKNISTCLMSGAFALLLSGSSLDAAASFFNGMTLAFVNQMARILKFRPMTTNVLASFLATVGARLLQTWVFTHANYDMIIAGSLMLMFPGTAITNAIRDTINGDYVSGAARAVEAFLTAASLAIGAGLGLLMMGGMLGW